jgi:LCP family protein required for cell wall assembly
MIEYEVRAAFARHEEPVGDVTRLRLAIEREAARRRRRRAVLRTSGAALAVAVVAALPGIGVDLFRDAERRSPLVAPDGGAVNLLVLGLDRRPGQQEDYLPGADTIMVVHVPATRDRAYLVSIPRDTRMEIPADPKTGRPVTDHVNSAFRYGSQDGGGVAGGIALTKRTLHDRTGLTFDGAVAVEMVGLQRVVDAVGGVSMCVDQRVTSIHTGRIFETGCRRLTGAEAMDFLRQRKGLPGGALDRDRHGRQFLRALAGEATRAGVLANPVRVNDIIRAAGSALTVDIPGEAMDDLLRALPGISADDLTGVRVPVRPADDLTGVRVPVRPADGDPAVTSGLDMVEPLATELFAAMREDRLGEFLAAHPDLVDHS